MSETLSSQGRILEGPVYKEMLRFGAPLALSMGLHTTFNLVEAYIVSRLPPDVAGPALGALGICDQISALGTIVSYGLTMASTAMIARAHGRGDLRLVRRIVWQSLLAVLAMSLVFGLASILLAGPILSGAVGAKGDVAALGAAYLRVSGGGAFSLFFLLQITGIQRALGSARAPFALLLLSNLLSLLLSVALVYGPGEAPPVFAWAPPLAAAVGAPRLELTGVSWATFIARTAALIPALILLIYRFRVLDRRSVTGPDRRVLSDIWRIAWPSSVQLVGRIAAMLITHALVARAFTTAADQTATTALGIVFRLETMALFVAMGWGSAAQTFVGQNLGQNQEGRARSSGYWATAYNAVWMLAIAALYQRAAGSLVVFFAPDPRVLAFASSYVLVVCWSYVGLGVGVVLANAINGAGATRTTMIPDLAVVLGFQIPVCTLAVRLAGATPERLWAAVAATYVLSGVVYLLVFRLARWTDVPVLERELLRP